MDISQLAKPVEWLNANQGIVSVAIFLLTLFLGWVSGIFSSLRRKSKLKITLIPGPTFCSILPTGQKYGGFEVHRTVFALYMNVANVGSAPTSIDSVSVGYHWNIRPLSWNWLRYRVGWFWLHNQAVALEDFQVQIGDRIKFYPFLTQRSSISGHKTDTYLETGRSVNGVVYYEQSDSWGGCQPMPYGNETKIVVSITDVFGKRFRQRFRISIVPLEEAREYNPSFGDTISALRRGPTTTKDRTASNSDERA